MNPLDQTSALGGLALQWGGFFLDLTVKGALIIAIVALLNVLLHRVSASTRHLLWTLGMVAVIALPLLRWALPSWKVSGFPGPFRESLEETAPAELQPKDGFPWQASGHERNDSLQVAVGPRGVGSPRVEPKEWFIATGESVAQAGGFPGQSAGRDVGIMIRNALPWGFAVWITGMASVLVIFLIGSLRLRHLFRNSTHIDDPQWTSLVNGLAERLDVRESPPLRRCRVPVTPMSWGLWRGVILLPKNCDEWTEEQRQDVLVHEISHLKRKDCLTQLLANVACVLYWFNPLMWFGGARMRTERERACDDQVLLAGSKASTYADNLLEIAVSLASENRSAYVSVAMARRSQISGRLMAMLDPRTRRGVPGRVAILTATLAMAAFVFPLAVLGPAGSKLEAKLATSVKDSPKFSRIDASLATETPFNPAITQGISAEEENAIREANREFELNLMLGSARGMARSFTDDSQMFPTFQQSVIGADEILVHCQNLIDAGVKKLKLETDELYSVGDVICEIGTFTVQGSSGLMIVRGNYMTFWKEEEGEWKIHRDISTF